MGWSLPTYTAMSKGLAFKTGMVPAYDTGTGTINSMCAGVLHGLLRDWTARPLDDLHLQQQQMHCCSQLITSCCN